MAVSRRLHILLSAILVVTLLSGCGGGGGGGSNATPPQTATTTTGTATTPTPTPVATPTPAPIPPGGVVAAGLAELNSSRALSGLPPLAEDPTLSAGAQAHAVYIVKNNALVHFEDPNNPFFTTAGNIAAQRSNIFGSTAPTLAIEQAVDSLMVGPFHGIAFIDPRLQTTGIGLHSENRGASVIQSAAVIDVLSGLGATSVTFPVLWPGPGSESPFATFTGNESPDPLTSLGFTAPTGAPIYVQLGPGTVTPTVTAFSITVNGVAVNAGEIDQTNYANPDPGAQALGRAILAQRSAVVLIPQQPLAAGARVAVSLTVNSATIEWTFTVATTPR